MLWLLNVDRSKGAIHEQIAGMASAAPHWLATAQSSVANASQGHGVTIATLLALASVADRARRLDAAGVPARSLLGAVLSLAYWVFGQSLGGPFWAGQATDVNTGPLLVLLALTLMPHHSSPPGPPDGRVADFRRRRTTTTSATPPSTITTSATIAATGVFVPSSGTQKSCP